MTEPQKYPDIGVVYLETIPVWVGTVFVMSLELDHLGVRTFVVVADTEEEAYEKIREETEEEVPGTIYIRSINSVSELLRSANSMACMYNDIDEMLTKN